MLGTTNSVSSEYVPLRQANNATHIRQYQYNIKAPASQSRHIELYVHNVR